MCILNLKVMLNGNIEAFPLKKGRRNLTVTAVQYGIVQIL